MSAHNLSPRNVIVTGGSRGLGLGIARMLRDGGYRVIAIARSPTDAMRDFHFVPFDLSDTAGIAALVSGIRKEFGAIYGLVNNAGLGTGGVLATMPDGEIGRLVALNTVAPMVLTKYVVRSMMAQGAGRIVNIASIVGSTGYAGLSVYSATKAALIGFTRSLARELGPLGITVNAVAPGRLDTVSPSRTGTGSNKDYMEAMLKRIPLHRLATAEEVAAAAVFLAGPGAASITGQTIVIDGGLTAA